MNRFILCLFCAAALVSSCGVKSFGPDKPDVEENVSDTVKQLRRLAAMELIEERDSTQTVFCVNKYEGGLLVERSVLNHSNVGSRTVFEYSGKNVTSTMYSVRQGNEYVSSVIRSVYSDETRTVLLSVNSTQYSHDGSLSYTIAVTYEYDSKGRVVKVVSDYDEGSSAFTIVDLTEYTDDLSYILSSYQDDMLVEKTKHTETPTERSEEYYTMTDNLSRIYKASYTYEKWSDGSRKQLEYYVSQKWDPYEKMTIGIERKYTYENALCSRMEEYNLGEIDYFEEYAYSEDGMMISCDRYDCFPYTDHRDHRHIDYVNDREFKLAEYHYFNDKPDLEYHLTWTDNSRTWTCASNKSTITRHTEIYR